jgi:hypothetical protein
MSEAVRQRGVLPPADLPPLPDPALGGEPGPYSMSALRDVTGTRIQPNAVRRYRDLHALRAQNAFTKTCVHPDLESWLKDIGSFDPRADIVQTPVDDLPMTPVIARMKVPGGRLMYPVNPMTFMVDYGELNQRADSLPQREWVDGLRDLTFPEGSDLLLSFFGNRAMTLGLWSLIEFVDAPFLSQFAGIVLPDFSAFSDDTTFQYLTGERMQQIFGQELSAAGHNVIPSIAYTTVDSLRRQVEMWTSQGPDRVNTILVDCYGSGVNKTLWAWHWLISMEKYMAPHTHIRWLVAGLNSGWHIRELNRIFPQGNYHLVSGLSMQVNAVMGSADREVQAHKFRRSLYQLERFRAGEDEAEPKQRPDYWPQFEHCRV